MGRVLKAALIFKGIMIEWVTVKGFDETFDDDLWAESRHQVFRKVQDHTHSAMLHFYSPTLPDLAVRFFMVNSFFCHFETVQQRMSIVNHYTNSVMSFVELLEH